MNGRLPEQDECRVGDLPFSGLQLRGGAQPELVEQDSRNRVGVRIVRVARAHPHGVPGLDEAAGGFIAETLVAPVISVVVMLRVCSGGAGLSWPR
jgi:hypothetical protein